MSLAATSRYTTSVFFEKCDANASGATRPSCGVLTFCCTAAMAALGSDADFRFICGSPLVRGMHFVPMYTTLGLTVVIAVATSSAEACWMNESDMDPAACAAASSANAPPSEVGVWTVDGSSFDAAAGDVQCTASTRRAREGTRMRPTVRAESYGGDANGGRHP